MSQQKMCLVAVCLLGAIAFASAQNFDYNACSRGIQKEIGEWPKRIVVVVVVSNSANNIINTINNNKYLAHSQPANWPIVASR